MELQGEHAEEVRKVDGSALLEIRRLVGEIRQLAHRHAQLHYEYCSPLRWLSLRRFLLIPDWSSCALELTGIERDLKAAAKEVSRMRSRQELAPRYRPFLVLLEGQMEPLVLSVKRLSVICRRRNLVGRPGVSSKWRDHDRDAVLYSNTRWEEKASLRRIDVALQVLGSWENELVKIDLFTLAAVVQRLRVETEQIFSTLFPQGIIASLKCLFLLDLTLTHYHLELRDALIDECSALSREMLASETPDYPFRPFLGALSGYVDTLSRAYFHMLSNCRRRKERNAGSHQYSGRSEYQDIQTSMASWRAAEIQWEHVIEYWPEGLGQDVM